MESMPVPSAHPPGYIHDGLCGCGSVVQKDSKAQLLRHFLEETSCSLHGGSILHMRISLHALQGSYSILHIKMHRLVETIPNHR